MEWTALRSGLAERRRGAAVNTFVGYGVVLAVGALLFGLCQERPTLMPFWAPWDFSSPEYLAFAFALLWFRRGLVLSEPEARPPVWRRIVFLFGLVAIWAVVQTHFDYMAQHMFFINRIQHVTMHHLGPFLVALGGAGPTLKRGMPNFARRLVEGRPVAIALRIVQQPVVAALLFVGLFYFWLVPPIEFRAMIDARLYAIMNWSMVLDGLLFWSLILDPRPKPPARLSFGVRAALSFSVMFPQIALGALIAFAGHDLYPYYNLCGRLIPSIDALSDQEIGGIVMWIPPAMMSVIGVLVVLNALRLNEESNGADDEASSSLAATASSWTGR